MPGMSGQPAGCAMVVVSITLRHGGQVMLQNKIVIRYQDGTLLKGRTDDFLPVNPSFHVSLIGSSPEDPPYEIKFPGVKAVFFVKNFEGNREHRDTYEFSPGELLDGRRIVVFFKDGEMLTGTTQGYDPGRPGFFVVPADIHSNNERIFVVSDATQRISFA